MATTLGKNEQPEEQIYPPVGGKKVSMDDLNSPPSNYMNMSIGSGGVEFVTKEILKVPEKKYYFKDKDGNAIEDPEVGSFKYVVVDEDGEKLSVNTWVLWNLLQQAFRTTGVIEGTKLQVDHPERGKYTVHYFDTTKNGWVQVVPYVREE